MIGGRVSDGGSGDLPLVYGKSLESVPLAVYIPHAPLRLRLDHFEGPMDLLLYLVRKNRFDIMDIPMAELCRQYANYARGLPDVGMETAGDYLSMSALLVEIKSKMLLPKPPTDDDEDGEDPRADLVRRLLEYERIRAVSAALAEAPRRWRDFASPNIVVEWPRAIRQKPVLQVERLAQCFADAAARARVLSPYRIARRLMTVRAAMSEVLRRIKHLGRKVAGFLDVAPPDAMGLGFLALLQLAAENTVTLSQDDGEAQLKIALTAANGK
ncbi:MAG: segregation and condensation protein A [Gammaproteobacteria bacterium]